MTNDSYATTRAELAESLTCAARNVSGLLTTEYPMTVERSYLHPVLGMLSAGPGVLAELNYQFEALLSTEPNPTTPARLLTVASHAAAMGWLAESFVELTTSVEEIIAHADALPEQGAVAAADLLGTDDLFGFPLGPPEREAIGAAAQAIGLTPADYLDLLSRSLTAAARIDNACTEIADGLLEDASHVCVDAPDDFSLDEGPGDLPTLVQSLLVRIKNAQ